jgi:hypothetical protein
LTKIAKYAGFDLPFTKKTLEFHDLMSPVSPYTSIHSKVYNQTISGPALVERNEKGQIHSLDGPAVIWANKSFFIFEYWIDGLPVSKDQGKFISREDIAWANFFVKFRSSYFLTEEDREKERKYKDLCMEYFVKDSRSPELRGIDPTIRYRSTVKKYLGNEKLYQLFRFVESYNWSKYLCPNNQIFVINMNTFLWELGYRGEEKWLSQNWMSPMKYGDNAIGTDRSITKDPSISVGLTLSGTTLNDYNTFSTHKLLHYPNNITHSEQLECASCFTKISYGEAMHFDGRSWCDRCWAEICTP